MTDDYEARVRRARKLARQFGLRLTNRRDHRGMGDFWMLGPPRTFEDIELELREEFESQQAERRQAKRQPAVRPVPEHTTEDFEELRRRLERHPIGRRLKAVKPPEEDTP